jgi:hypothetical protein
VLSGWYTDWFVFESKRRLMMRDVLIVGTMNGYMVKVGCQTLVFESATTLLAELGRYLSDPAKVEQEYLERYHPAPVTDEAATVYVAGPGRMASEPGPLVRAAQDMDRHDRVR